MKLRNRMRALIVLAAAALASCATQARDHPQPPIPALNGPAADYPVILGEPFAIGDVTYTPIDVLNYDQVGYVAAEGEGAPGVTGAHKTLPLPSYVEVTALDSGRTALVRLERRGPMVNDRLIGLSPGALQQLGIGEGAPIRMRRVNPPEDHRALLRAGGEAPLRMDTPQGLLDVLKRRLQDPPPLVPSSQEAISAAGADLEARTAPAPLDWSDPNAELNASASQQVSKTEAEAPAEAASPEPVVASDGRYAVQLGAFSVAGNAARLAEKVGGYVETSGALTLVNIGPFATRGQASEALAKLRTQGYSDALIRTLD